MPGAAGHLPPVPPDRRPQPRPGKADRCVVLCAPARHARPAPIGSPPVERIAISGCGGSGKSHVARALGAALGISPVHLDTLYYDQDWNPLPKEEFAALQNDIVTQPQWIIDGNY